MSFAIFEREDLEELKELATSKNQVNEVRLQDRSGKQNCHEDTKKYLSHLLIQPKKPLKT